jgi:hypothetical protein
MSTARINIDLLQDADIGIRGAEKINDCLQLEPAVDVPINYAERTARPHYPPHGRKVAGNNILRCHAYTLSTNCESG